MKIYSHIRYEFLALLLLSFSLLLPSVQGALIEEGFDGFDTGTRPSGWTFTGCDQNTDTYTTAGDYGVASPSIKLDLTGDSIKTASFLPGDCLQFWVKGQGTDSSSQLLVEEYYASWTTVTDIMPLPTTGLVLTDLSLKQLSTQLKFSYTQAAGDVAIDDILVYRLITPTPPPTGPGR